ncbi:hypothetical protein V8E53_007009 [Lactarius tabidus]
MPAPLPPPHHVLPNVAEITAPLLLGTVWNWTLYGVLITQFYVYYNFPDDSKRLKYIGLALSDLYYWFGSGFGDLRRVASAHLSVWDGPLLGSVTAVTVQLFFAYRIWVLSEKKSWWLCLMVSLFSTVGGISEASGGIYSYVVKDFSRGVLKTSALIWLIGSVLTDGLITFSMLYLLGRRRSQGTSFFSKNAVSKIVRLTVETNLLTSAQILNSATVTTTALVLIVVKPDKDWFNCPTAVIGKLYANALLATLNNRIVIRDGPARKAAIRFPDAAPPSGKHSKDTSDFMHFQHERPPSGIVFMPPNESVRISRESEGRDVSLGE